MNVICLNDEAFYALISEVVARLKEGHSEKRKWITDVEAMRLLNIKSKTTLQKYRDQGLIEFTQAGVKPILYNIDSIKEFHERHKKARF